MLTTNARNAWKVIALLLVGLGIFLRIYRVTDLQAFYGDNALDLLVASHLVQEENPPVVRPFAVGGQNVLQNTPLYFQVLAQTLRFVGETQNIVLIFTLLGILTIFVSYKIGKEVEGLELGLFFAVLTAISFPLINMSRTVWQPNYLPFFTVLAIYLLLLAKKRTSLFWLASSFAATSFGFFTHFAFAPLFVGLNVMYLFVFKDLIQKNRINALALIPYFTAILLIWKSFQVEGESQPLRSLFTTDLSELARWPEVIQIILQQRFLDLSLFDSYFVNLGLLLLVMAGLLQYTRSQKLHHKNDYFPRVLLVLMFMSIIPVFFTASLFAHYLTPYFVILSLLLGVFFKFLATKARFLFIAFALLFAWLNFETMGSMRYLFDETLTTERQYEQLITDEIIRDYRAREGINDLNAENFSAKIIDTHDFSTNDGNFENCVNCTTSSQHLLLEEEFETHFTRLTANPLSYDNIVTIMEKPKYYYFVCRHNPLAFSTDKKPLLDVTTANCIPKADIFNTQDTYLKLESSYIPLGNHYFSNAVLFVLKREHRPTSQ